MKSSPIVPILFLLWIVVFMGSALSGCTAARVYRLWTEPVTAREFDPEHRYEWEKTDDRESRAASSER